MALLRRHPQKTQISFAKEPYKREYILQKRPIFLRSLLIIATPYGSSEDFLNHRDSHFGGANPPKRI